MKPKFWNVFIAMVSIFSIPLAFLFFFFSGSKSLGWVSNLSLAIMLLFGLIGGVRGFIIYGIQRQPGPLSKYLKLRKPISNYKRILLALSTSVACLAMVLFGYAILFLVNGGGDIQVNTGKSFFIQKPGQYTLWASSENVDDVNVSNLAGQLKITHDQDNKTVQRKPLFMQAEYRSNGEKFVGICIFQVPNSGSYHLFMPTSYRAEKFVVHRSFSLGLMLAAVFSFLVGFSTMLFSVYLVWSGRIVLPKPQD